MKSSSVASAFTAAVLLGALWSDAKAQGYVSYPGAVTVVTQDVTSGNPNAGGLTSAFSEAGLMQQVINAAWAQGRGPACDKVKALWAQ